MPRRVAAVLGTMAAVALLYALLALPNQPGVITPAGLRRFPLELPALLLLLMAAPGGWLLPLRAGLVVLLTTTTVTKLADLATETAFRRPFNPVLDGALVPAAWHLTAGSLGLPLALAAAAALLAAVLLAAWGIWHAAGRIAALGAGRRRLALALAVPAVAVAALDASGRYDPPGYARTSQMAAEHLRAGWTARLDLARFREDAARDGRAGLAPERILPALRGTDVLLVFAESYGRSTLTNPRYAATTVAALRDGEAEIAAAGLAAVSGFLTAPMTGGQSWLAHASLLSGLRIDNQGRYRALIASPRRTLLHFAREAGWTTAAVMPAITFAWPEASYFGYDRVLATADLDYRGPPFSWVTMPDQFTLSAFERQLLGPRPRPAVFAEIALISSHAPWTPLPTPLPWPEVGDGSIFAAQAAAGEAPATLWLDEDRVRDQFRQSIDYVLRVVAGFAAQRAADPPLVVLLGDHQPAVLVSEDPENRDVPIHVIGPPDLVERLEGWGWTRGLVPDQAVPAWPMEDFRDRFLDAFAEPGAQPMEAAAAP